MALIDTINKKVSQGTNALFDSGGANQTPFNNTTSSSSSAPGFIGPVQTKSTQTPFAGPVQGPIQAPTPKSSTVQADNIGVAPVKLPEAKIEPAPVIPPATQDVFTTPSGAQVDAQGNLISGAATPPPPAVSTGKSPAEGENVDLKNRLAAAYEKAGGVITPQEAAKEAGVPQAEQNVMELQAQVNALRNEANIIPLQIQQEAMGRGITAAGAAPLQAAKLRENAIQALSLNSFLYAAQGQLALAQDNADRAVEAEMAPIQREIDMLREFLDLNKDDLTREDKKKADQLAIDLDERQRLLDIQAAEKTAIYDIGISAAPFVDAQTLNQIQKAGSKEEAIQIAAGAGAFTQGVKINSDVVKLDNGDTIIINKDTGEVIKNLGGRKVVGALDPKTVSAAKSAIPGIVDKINGVNQLINHPGMTRAVGVYGVARWTPLTPDKADVAEFVGGVEQLLAKETMDTLAALKARGGTLGALSDQERIMLQNAATKIGSWKRTDDTGRTTGYEVSEAAFTKELEFIRDNSQIFLAELRKQAGEGTLSEDDLGELDALFGDGGDAVPPNAL